MTRVLKRERALMPCKLTSAEFVERSLALANTIEDMANLDGRHESLKRQMKLEVAEIEAKRGALATAVRNKSEYREVDIEHHADDKKLRVIRVRMDTGEVVGERAMDDKERQTTLKLQDEINATPPPGPIVDPRPDDGFEAPAPEPVPEPQTPALQ